MHTYQSCQSQNKVTPYLVQALKTPTLTTTDTGPLRYAARPFYHGLTASKNGNPSQPAQRSNHYGRQRPTTSQHLPNRKTFRPTYGHSSALPTATCTACTIDYMARANPTVANRSLRTSPGRGAGNDHSEIRKPTSGRQPTNTNHRRNPKSRKSPIPPILIPTASHLLCRLNPAGRAVMLLPH